MGEQRTRRSSPQEFVRVGICVYDLLDGNGKETALAHRIQAMSSVDKALHASHAAIAPIIRPKGALPLPKCEIIPAPPEPKHLSRVVASAIKAGPKGTLARFVVHADPSNNLDVGMLRRTGIPLMVSVTHDSDWNGVVSWEPMQNGVPQARVSSAHLTRVLHDVVLDIWAAHHLDEPYRGWIRGARERGDIYHRKVAFAHVIGRGEVFPSGLPHAAAGYVSFASLCRGDDGQLDADRFVELWQRFAVTLNPQPPANESDEDTPLTKARHLARLVAKDCKRSLKIEDLARKIVVHRAGSIAILVLIKKANARQEAQVSGLGLRGMNTPAVFSTSSKEWATFHRLVDRLAGEGLIHLAYASLNTGALNGDK